MRDIKLKKMMHAYFEETALLNEGYSLQERASCIPEEVPVSISDSTWEIVTSPNRLMKTFHFDTFERMKTFLNELLNYQEDVGHHAKLTVDSQKIIVEIYTHGVDDITELDTEYAVMADAIDDDTSNFLSGDKGENIFVY